MISGKSWVSNSISSVPINTGDFRKLLDYFNLDNTGSIPYTFTVEPKDYYSNIKTLNSLLGDIVTKNQFKPKRVIYNDPATVVFWEDGTKTVVKCAPGTEFDEYHGFCAALAKKIYGGSCAVHRAAGLPKQKKKKADGPTFHVGQLVKTGVGTTGRIKRVEKYDGGYIYYLDNSHLMWGTLELEPVGDE